MKRTSLLAVLLAVPLMACTTGTVGDDVVGDDSGGDDTTTPPGTTIGGNINTDQTLSGVVRMTGDAVVSPGVTLTLSAATEFPGAPGTTLTVSGTLLVQGALGTEARLVPVPGQPAWGGIVAQPGSTINIMYASVTGMDTIVDCKAGASCTLDHVTSTAVGKAVQADGNVTITRSRLEVTTGVFINTGTVLMADSVLLGTSGDTIVQSGGSLTMEYSDVGNMNSTGDHCAMHLNPGSDAIVTYSIIRSTPYGLMINGTSGVVFNFNNWLDNTADIDRAASNNVNADFQNNYFPNGTPLILQPNQFNFNNVLLEPVPDAGPRPE